MIRINNISKKYTLGKTEIHALRGVNLSVNEGQMICVMGPSGSGKSTMLNIIGCLDKPDSGDVFIGKYSVAGLGRNDLAALRADMIGFIFQSFNLIPVLNVYENIEFPLHIKNSGLTKKEMQRRVMRLVDEVGLNEYVKHRPDELSGGQRQRVAIARALVTNPKIILADEPTANLDSATAKSILSIMKTLNHEEKSTFIFSTHDPSIAEYSDSVCRMKDGFLLESAGR